MKLTFNLYTPKTQWDLFLSNEAKYSSFLQSTRWARINMEIFGAIPLYLCVLEYDKPVACLMALHYPGAKTVKLTNKYSPRLEFNDGPVIFSNNVSLINTGTILLLNTIDQYCVQNKIPFITASGLSDVSRVITEPIPSEPFIDHNYNVFRWGTFIVDLHKDEDTLWMTIKRSARKSIKKARRIGVMVVQIQNLEELHSQFYQPYARFEKSFDRRVTPWHYFASTWEVDRQENYAFYVANSADGEVLGTLGMYYFNRVATEIASSISPAAYQQKIPVQDLLHWEIMLDARRKGCDYFNLAGVNPNPTSAKEHGIRQFKEKWGGRYVEYPIFRKDLHWVPRLHNWLKRQRQKFPSLYLH